MKLLLFFFISISAGWAQSPACNPPRQTLTTATTGTVFKNNTANPPCNAWSLQWDIGDPASSITALSIQLEGSDDNVTWSAFSGSTTVLVGTNPSTALTGAIIVQGSSKLGYIRLNITSLTGTGTVNTRLYGYNGVSPAAKSGSGGTPGGPAGGDLCGSYPNPTVCGIEGAAIPVSATVAATDASSHVVAAPLANTDVWIGSAGNLPVAHAISGDCTLSNTGVITCPTKTLSGSSTFAFASPICDGCCLQGSSTITVTGAAVGDAVAIGSNPALADGLNVLGKATSTNTITVEVCNWTGAAVTPSSRTYLASVAK